MEDVNTTQIDNNRQDRSPSQLNPTIANGTTGDNMGLSDLWKPDDADQQRPDLSIEQWLRNQGRITPEQLEQAKSIHHKTPKKRLGQILLDMNIIDEADLLRCIAEQYGLPYIRIDEKSVQPNVIQLLEKDFMKSHSILPIQIEQGKLVVATADPTNVFLLDEVQRKAKMPLIVKVCPSEDIDKILTDENESADFEVDDLIQDVSDDDVEVIQTQEEDIADLERAAGDSPIIKFVNYIIFNAIKEGASDIHLEPGDKKFKIRYRIDGILFNTLSPPHTMHPAIVSRIKIMSNLDIAERRLPQDGRLRVMVHHRSVDMRISTIPTSHGEKVVIRIMDMGQTQYTLTDLGMDENNLAIIDQQITQPHGIILVTGPTGSGKSTTLYSCLQCMDTTKLNIATVEDPVEYDLDGVCQTQVHEKIGMTFAAALRSLLRQDPDVIMVGEIRDEETARIAVQASLTGHLVFSTLHTNDAPASITRLINIGIESYLIAASTNVVLAQRLVRKICEHCKQPFTPGTEQAQYLSMYGFNGDNLYHGKGCEQCRQTGFHGRMGLFELLVIDDTYRDIITKNPTVTELRRLSQERGMVSLRNDGLQKAQQGLTTIDEVMRVTASTI